MNDTTVNVTDPATTVAWKYDWARARQRIEAWWRREGLLLNVTAPLDTPRLDLPQPDPPDDMPQRWLSPTYRAQRALDEAAGTFYGGEKPPHPNCLVGAGDLGAFLGCKYGFAETTCWFEPCIDDLAAHPPMRFDPDHPNCRAVYDMLAECRRVADGRYLVGMPDLVENFDILAAMRGAEMLMIDCLDQRDEVEQRIEQINHAFFAAYEHFYNLLKAPDGSVLFDAFSLWGPGRVAKVQCDAAAMISPAMFNDLVAPGLTRQCDWLDYSMYHLDGEDAMCQLDTLLSIESLDAIEWTPRYLWTGDSGGSAKWYDLYRRIKDAGKSVQAIGVKVDEVEPLLDAVGPAGMSLFVRTQNETQARALIERVEAYR